MFADYFIVGKGKPENWHSRDGIYIAGVIAWLASVVLSYIVQLDFAGIGFAIVIYLILEKIWPSTSRPTLNK